MKNITVLGSDGMLGHVVVKYLISKKYDVLAQNRQSFELSPTNESVIGVKLFRATVPETEYVINCIGAIKPTFASNPLNAIYINSIFPRQLANVCEKTNKRLIHITTDCVFDGLGGPYNETREHNATDEYGKSKSLGEPPNCLVLRTSIIGPEIGNRKRSLLEWAKGQAGETVNGFTNHIWNGLTTLELAKVIENIIQNNWYRNGTFHIFSTDINKADLLKKISSVYDLKLKVKEMVKLPHCDRRLITAKDLNQLVAPADIDTMLTEMNDFE